MHHRLVLALLLTVGLWAVLSQPSRGDSDVTGSGAINSGAINSGAIPDGTALSPEMLLAEAQAVYLTNLARRANGLPPLRWNAQLTEAARWFSWDSVAQRPDPYCGHQDTLNRWPGERARLFGYLGFAGAENAFCGDVTPRQAVDGWMQSTGHRQNLLAPDWREVGLGYYRQPAGMAGDQWRSYVTQDFGRDSVHPPAILADEALTTTTPTVDLYVYRNAEAGFTAIGPATEMMVSNDLCLAGAAWEPYTPQRAWTLAPGAGWRTVTVKTRDALGRTVTVSDTIYLGTDLPSPRPSSNGWSLLPEGEGDERPGEGPDLSAGEGTIAGWPAALLSGASPRVTLYPTRPSDLPLVQFSPGWLGDDSFSTFKHWWGAGERVADPAARGGTVYRLRSGAGESFAWLYTCDFARDVPLVAYFRLKVADNREAGEVARLAVAGSGVDYGPLSLRGTDFAAPDVYQEFALPFVFPSGEDPFLIFKWWRSGETDVTIDSVSIFSAPQPATVPLVWEVPGGNYRGQGVWLRYTDGQGRFTDIQEASPYPPGWQVSPGALALVAEEGGAPPPPMLVRVRPPCGACGWQAQSDADWLTVEEAGPNGVIVGARCNKLPRGGAPLPPGTYTATLTLSATDDGTAAHLPPAGVPPLRLPVTLHVVAELYQGWVPVVGR